MLGYLLTAVAAATFANSSPANQPQVEPPTVAPISGSYFAMDYVPSTEGSGCVVASGSQLLSEVSYGGVKGKTFFIKSPYSASNGQVVSIQILTVTSGLGSLAPSGTLEWTGYGSANWSVSGTFTAAITEVGTHAFMLSLSETFGDCTEKQELSLVRMAVDND